MSGHDVMTTLLGWTLAQWAEAAAYYKRWGVLPARSMHGAYKVHRFWRSKWPGEPGDLRLLEVAHEMEWAWASSMWSAVASEVRQSIFQRPV